MTNAHENEPEQERGVHVFAPTVQTLCRGTLPTDSVNGRLDLPPSLLAGNALVPQC